MAAVLAVFAVRVESDLSGAGWHANGSQSVAVRQLAQRDFGGQASAAIEVVVASYQPLDAGAGPGVIRQVEALLRRDPRVSTVSHRSQACRSAPTARRRCSWEELVVILGGAGVGPNQMVRTADTLQQPLSSLSGHGIVVRATGASMLWSGFNAANRSAMLRSEMLTWPVTMAILVVAFGSLVAAGLPLLLTLLGLLSAAGLLALLSHLTPISIWAMNFAMMFALALGIDYALFILVRFRGARFGRSLPVADAVAETMDTAGKAVLFAGLTVLISLSTVLVVPSPAFRSMAVGIMLAVAFVLAGTLTLLPAVLGRLGDRVDRVDRVDKLALP